MAPAMCLPIIFSVFASSRSSHLRLPCISVTTSLSCMCSKSSYLQSFVFYHHPPQKSERITCGRKGFAQLRLLLLSVRGSFHIIFFLHRCAPIPEVEAFILALIADMTSLLARLLTSTVRADVPPNAPSSKSSEQAESTRKSYKKHASNARARKSITSLFGFAAKIPAVEDGFVCVLQDRSFLTVITPGMAQY